MKFFVCQGIVLESVLICGEIIVESGEKTKSHTFYPQNFEKNDKKLIKFKKKEDSVAANLKFTKHDFIIYDLVLLEPVESSSKHAVEFGNALHWLDLL